MLNREWNLDDLVISKRISKDPDKYVTHAHQAIAAKQLRQHGIGVTAGQTVRYIILDADNKRAERRVKAAQLINAKPYCDAEKYIKMLKDALYNIISPFTQKTALTLT